MYNEYTLFKSNDDKRLVFGWASISEDERGELLTDLQGDIIEPDILEDTAYQYVLDFRDAGEEHIPSMRKKGRLVESCVFTKEKQAAIGIPKGLLPVGWWIGFYIDDDEAWQRIKSGKYQMFSVEGKAVREPVEKRAGLTFLEVLKYNKNHDQNGRFAEGSSVGNKNSKNNGKTLDKPTENGKMKSFPKAPSGWNKNAKTRPAQGKVVLPNGNRSGYKQGTQLTGVVHFAGPGSKRNTPVKKAGILSKKYGGSESGWKHSRGNGIVKDNETGKYRKAEVHWFEHDDIGMVNEKVKRWFE